MRTDEIRHKKIVIIALILLWLFTLLKIHFGIHSDEVHSIAAGDMIARGDSFFKECWFYLQMSAVFTAPIIFVYERITGGREGILLVFRFLSVCIQSGICIYFYHVFKEKYRKTYVLIASILLFVFIPDIQSFVYKQELLWFATMEIIFSYKYYLTLQKRYLILLGTMIAGSVLAYPTALIQFPVYLFLIFGINKIKMQSKNTLKDSFVVALTCVLCAIFFFLVVLRRISIFEFISFFPRVFQDNNLDDSFLSKLIHPLIKFGIMGGMTIFPLMLCRKVKRPLSSIVTILLWVAFLGQLYIERRGVTWHCITYPYALTVFIVPFIYLVDSNKKNDRIIIYLFEIPAIEVILSIALASNQGNITSMYGTIFSAVALVLMLGDKESGRELTGIGKEKHFIATSMCVCALSMYFIPIWEQEAVMPDHMARTIFSERFLVTEGPAKGIFLGDMTYEQYLRLYRIVKKNVSEEDKVFIIDDNYTAAYGYLASVGSYATFSPQGGWGLAESDQAVDYFIENYEKRPTIVIIRLDYIQSELEEYLEETLLGGYLLKNGYYLYEESDGYAVMRNEYKKVY